MMATKRRARVPTTPPLPADPIGPTPEALRHAHITLVQPLRYERGEPVARLLGLHDRLVDMRRISEPQWLWATRYCREIEILAGGRAGKSETERVDEWLKEPVYDRAVAAAAFIRRAHERMNLEQRAFMMSACVLAHRIGDVAILMGIPIRPNETMGQFAARVTERVNKRGFEVIQAGSGIDEKPQKTAEKIVVDAARKGNL